MTIAGNDATGFATMFSGKVDRSVEASDDGENFREVAKLNGGGSVEHTYSFPAATAKYFRVVFKEGPKPPLPAWLADMDTSSLGFGRMKPDPDYSISELILHPGARVNLFEDKAAFSSEGDIYSLRLALVFSL